MSKDWAETGGRKVPTGRVARAARLGSLGAGVMGNVLGGGARALLSGQRPDAQSLVMTPRNMTRLADELARMRGAAMKMGQMLSMEAGDILPTELAAVLARLRDDGQTMPPAQLKQVLQAEYGPGFLKRFKRFDPRPVAAASIGQVHKAVTHEGRVLALKVQYPGIRAAIDADVANLGTLLRVSGLLPKGIALPPLMDELRRQLHQEADYRREAQELTAARASAPPGFLVPEVAAEFSTKAILAMDFIDSQPIESLETAPQTLRDDVARRLFAHCLTEILHLGFVQTDPNFANFRWQPDRQEIVLLDYGASRHFDAGFTAQVRQMLRLGLEGDQDAILGQLRAMDIVPGAAPAGQMAILDQMIAMAVRVFRQPQVDFSDTSFLEAMREAGMQLGLREEFRHIPPWDVLYLQRKVAGLVLLATRLRARVALRDLVQEAL